MMAKRGVILGLAAILAAASSLLGNGCVEHKTLILDRQNSEIMSFSNNLSKRVYTRKEDGKWRIFMEYKRRGRIVEKEIYSTEQEITKVRFNRDDKIYFEQRGEQEKYTLNLDGSWLERIK